MSVLAILFILRSTEPKKLEKTIQFFMAIITRSELDCFLVSDFLSRKQLTIPITPLSYQKT